MLEYLKVWKPRPISIGEFEDLWEQNNRFEVAKAYLILLKEAENISLKEKLEFLTRLMSEPLYKFGIFWNPRARDKRNIKLQALAIKTFLELNPLWNDGFERECQEVMRKLGRISVEDRKGWEHKIKTFIHSLLNTKKKTDKTGKIGSVPIGDVVDALVNNRMFEELVSYDLATEGAIIRLVDLIFGVESKDYTLASYLKRIPIAEKENREPHAVSVLRRILAKRGESDRACPSPHAGGGWGAG